MQTKIELCVGGGMVYTLVLEASAERIESSSLSRRTTIWADSDNGSTVALQASGGSSILPRSTKKEIYENTKTQESRCLSFNEAWR